MTSSWIKTHRVALAFGACVALFALLVQLSSAVGSPLPRYVWAFAPGLLGVLLVGGVNGPAPALVKLIAWGTAIGCAWALVAYVAIAASKRLRDIKGS